MGFSLRADVPTDTKIKSSRRDRRGRSAQGSGETGRAAGAASTCLAPPGSQFRPVLLRFPGNLCPRQALRELLILASDSPRHPRWSAKIRVPS